MTASKSGYVHPNGGGAMAASGAGANGGVNIGEITISVNPSLSFPNAAPADAEGIARTVMARIREEMSAAMRGVMADVSMA